MTEQLRTILVDDEKHSLESLEIEITRHCPELTIIDSCKGAKAGIDSIRSNRPDLVLLDIDMPVMNGFELLKEVQDIPFDVIFCHRIRRVRSSRYQGQCPRLPA